MTQTQALQFNYAGLEPAGDFLPSLKIEEGKKVLVSFLKTIPGMQSPPFVYCKVHWNSEMGENGRMFQCFGGSCCQQVTWQKGWNGEPGKFEANKARTRFYIPVVHYEQDPKNPISTIATTKFIDMTYTAYDSLIETINNNTGSDFFEVDIILEAQKVNGAMTYLFYKQDRTASWMTNEILKQQVDEQLETLAERLMESLPKALTEAEFMKMKPQLDAKVQAAMASHGSVNAAAKSAQAAYGIPGLQSQTAVPGLPQSLPQMPAAPVVNLPSGVVPPAVPVPPATEVVPPAVPVPPATEVVPPATEVAPPAAPVTIEIPSVSLDFDPAKILK